MSTHTHTHTHASKTANIIREFVLSHGQPRDAAVHFGTYPSLHPHRMVFTSI